MSGCGSYICSYLLQAEASLIMAEQGTDLCVLQNVIRSHIIAIFYVKDSLRTFGFAFGPWAIYSQVLGHLRNVRYGPHLMEWALGQIRYWLVTPTVFMPPLH